MRFAEFMLLVGSREGRWTLRLTSRRRCWREYIKFLPALFPHRAARIGTAAATAWVSNTDAPVYCRYTTADGSKHYGLAVGEQDRHDLVEERIELRSRVRVVPLIEELTARETILIDKALCTPLVAPKSRCRTAALVNSSGATIGIMDESVTVPVEDAPKFPACLLIDGVAYPITPQAGVWTYPRPRWRHTATVAQGMWYVKYYNQDRDNGLESTNDGIFKILETLSSYSPTVQLIDNALRLVVPHRWCPDSIALVDSSGALRTKTLPPNIRSRLNRRILVSFVLSPDHQRIMPLSLHTVGGKQPFHHYHSFPSSHRTCWGALGGYQPATVATIERIFAALRVINDSSLPNINPRGLPSIHTIKAHVASIPWEVKFQG